MPTYTDAPTYYAHGPKEGDHCWSGFPKGLEMSIEQHQRCVALAGDGFWVLDAVMPEKGAIIYCDGPGRYFHVRHDGSAQEVSFDNLDAE